MRAILLILSLFFSATSFAHGVDHPAGNKIIHVDSSLGSEYRFVGTYYADCNFIDYSFGNKRLRNSLYILELFVSQNRKRCIDDMVVPLTVQSPWYPIEEGKYKELVVPSDLYLETR